MDNLNLLRYILPKEIAEHFDLINVKSHEERLDFYLDEKSIIPPEHLGKDLESKGFTNAIQLSDFPIRENKVVLHLRRRKWRDKATGEIYTRHWELKVKGTSYTKELADFFKETLR